VTASSALGKLQSANEWPSSLERPGTQAQIAFKTFFGFICNYVFSYHDPGQEYIVEIQDDHFQPEEPQEINPKL
jgi:hypothetical protein